MPVSWLVLLLVLQMSTAYAAQSDTQPDEDLLAFIGEWETSDGAWFDPLPDDKSGHPTDQDKEKQDDAP